MSRFSVIVRRLSKEDDMLPEITFKNVTRDDVDRIAWWLDDVDLSNRWFGRYSADDPVHLGYDPLHMLEASDWEWNRTFGDPRRTFFSIYNTADEHVGECQVQLDGTGGAALSVIIGRKDLWHHGYGTAAMLELLDKVFNGMGLDQVWVTVPTDNRPAIGLFEKLGFTIDHNYHAPNGSVDAVHMTVSADRYSTESSRAQRERELTPIVTITGLPGSQSELLGREVARLLDSEFIDDEIRSQLANRLQCSPAEIAAFENSYKSFWMRLLGSIVIPTELSAAYESGYYAYGTGRAYEYDQLVTEPITKQQYIQKLRGLVRRYSAEGNAVLHGNGCHLFTPSQSDGLAVYVSSSADSRAARFAPDGVAAQDSRKRLERADQEHKEVFNRLFGCAVDDGSKFDITVNLDRMSIPTAAKLIVDVLERRSADQAPTLPQPSVRVHS